MKCDCVGQMREKNCGSSFQGKRASSDLSESEQRLAKTTNAELDEHGFASWGNTINDALECNPPTNPSNVERKKSSPPLRQFASLSVRFTSGFRWNLWLSGGQSGSGDRAPSNIPVC